MRGKGAVVSRRGGGHTLRGRGYTAAALSLCIRAARVLPDAQTEIEAGAVVVRDGHIAWVGPAADAPAADEVIDLEDATLTPGWSTRTCTSTCRTCAAARRFTASS